jgi:transcriptional regulator with GAF, ATPase, and Fis domain
VLSTSPVVAPGMVSMAGSAATRAITLPSSRLRENLEWAEEETLRRALKTANGKKKTAAALMGISPRALSYYLRKYPVDQDG